MDEPLLLKLLATDLDRGFEPLVRSYQEALYRFALRLTNHPSEAEEAVQDTFVRVYRALDGYPPERIRSLSLRPWLYRITLNVCRNRLRRRAVATVPYEGEGEMDEAPGPPEMAASAEVRSELALLLMELSEPHRAAVVLRHVEGLSYGEIAEVLGQPVGTVKANVHRGLSALRTALKGEIPA